MLNDKMMEKVVSELSDIKKILNDNRTGADEVIGLDEIIKLLNLSIEQVHDLLEYEVLPVVYVQGTVISTRQSILDWVRRSTGNCFF